jgi:branched-chain amino acid transport system ATP-binding protein|tara:strand:- start:5590 stop:6387 length:798 start_codon:yes stop_codon:yes gene_type:complete
MKTVKSDMSEVLLNVENIAISFGGLVAISDLSFNVYKGEIVSLIGPNGAGKTTAFNIITGFLKPNSGSITYRDKSLTGLAAHQVAKYGVVRTFQKTSVFDGNTVIENIMMGLHLNGRCKVWEVLLGLPRVSIENTRLEERALEILDLVGLSNRASDMASDLAYGELRLLEVAIALAAEPALLLLDEPASGMNPSETASFMKTVSKIRDEGTTILLVEHDMRMVMGISDRVVVLNQGEIIASGTPKEIQNNPKVIHAYLGYGDEDA